MGLRKEVESKRSKALGRMRIWGQRWQGDDGRVIDEMGEDL